MSQSILQTRKIEASTLANGMRVITETIPHVRSVAVGLWIGSGARRETKEQSGISHFIEHMVFQGTENRTAEDIARSVDSIGGNLDAFTAKELVSFNTKVLDEHLSLAFDVLCDLILHPLFREPDIEKEKGVVLEELKIEVDNPDCFVHELFSSSFWKGHPLGKSILGTKETVRGFNRAMIRDYFEAIYAPSNLLITAAGNVKHERLLGLAREKFENLPARDPLPADRVPRTHAGILLKDKRSLEQTHLCLGVPSYPINHELRHACYVLNTLLGGGMSSRLFQNIREKRGLAYSVYSELSLYRDTGCLLVSAGTSIEAAAQVIRLTLEEFTRFKQEPVTPEELRRAKDQLKGSLMLGLESTSSRMANLARQELFFGRFFTLDEILESIEEVTAGQLQSISQHFFAPEKISLTVLGNLNGFRVERHQLSC